MYQTCRCCVSAEADLVRLTEPATRSFPSSHDEALGLSTKASLTIYQYIGKCDSLAILVSVHLLLVSFYVWYVRKARAAFFY